MFILATRGKGVYLLKKGAKLFKKRKPPTEHRADYTVFLRSSRKVEPNGREERIEF